MVTTATADRLATVMANSDFRGFIDYWKVNFYCPLPLADWLQERDHDDLSAAVKWVCSQQPRKVWEKRPEKSLIGVCPTEGYWYRSSNGKPTYADELPEAVFDKLREARDALYLLSAVADDSRTFRTRDFGEAVCVLLLAAVLSGVAK